MTAVLDPPRHTVTQRLRVRGAVQGVGFRPFVYRLAHELDLAGWVRNDGHGVEIEVEGSADAIAALSRRLQTETPRLARIDSIETQTLPRPQANTQTVAGFRIIDSRAGAVTTGITADAAVCDACLADLFDPAGRRWRYPFTNCTHCGPRFTLTARLPYDRPNTSMARFTQCAACQAEYDAPADRRFHAQPNACPVCGPRLALVDPEGAAIACDDVLAETLRRLRRGVIVAIKGLGGFQLVCDARHADAVARLRLRKQRDEKPFAVMVANVASLAALAQVDSAAAAVLGSAAAPIVLLPKCAGCDAQLPGVAPGLAELGVMLPTTPLHWLLLHEAAGRPAGSGWTRTAQPLVLVMTSANPGGEPLVIDNDEARQRLGGIADAFLLHDRDVLVRCDDSVVRVDHRPATADHGSVHIIRRARGYTPAPIVLSPRLAAAPAVLATGAYLKNTACLTRGGQALLSQHIGDLDNAPSCRALEEAVEHLQRVLVIRPQAVAHDLHPDSFATRLAVQLAAQWQVPTIGVQHHHAHVAAVLAEHRHDGPALGLALDGVGLGDDGDAWGGELLRVDGSRFARRGHLRALPLAGGDRAAREPWRLGAAVLHLLGRPHEIEQRYAEQPAAAAVAQLLARDLRCPLTTSAGRWFDAAASVLGVRQIIRFEGQAAMQLEALATQHGPVAAEADAFTLHDDGTLDLLPLLARLLEERDAARGAARFHATLALALAQWAQAAAEREDIDTIALGGGCFLNRLLSVAVDRPLTHAGLRVLHACQAPPNDGGISLGQAWVALNALQGDR
jgi:hydrogenase maturation protein HypF